MPNEEYIKQFRTAVADLLATGELGTCGLCYSLCERGFEYAYSFMAAAYLGDFGRLGVWTSTRVIALLLLAELDDDTLIYIKERAS